MDFASKIASDCSNLADLPDLNFKLGEYNFPLPASAYVLKIEGKCYGAFMPLTMETDHGLAWVLGLPFLRHYYTLWDRQGPSLYFAEQGDNCKPKPIASNVSVELARIQKSQHYHMPPPELTEGDLKAARLPSWAPR